MKIYGIMSTKGGVGKTTTCANLGAICADMKQRTLLVDADPQQSLSRVYSVSQEAPFGLTQMYRSANPDGCISHTDIPNLDIVLNDDPGADNGAISAFLRQSVTHFHNLWVALQVLKDDYDYIIIDTQGAKGIIQESVIFASDVLLSPVKAKALDTREFIGGFVEIIKKFSPKPGFPSITGRPMPLVKVLFNMWDRTNDSSVIARHLHTEFDKETDGQITVLSTVVPALEAYSQAVARGIPVHRYETNRRGSTASANEVMLSLIHELEPKLGQTMPEWT